MTGSVLRRLSLRAQVTVAIASVALVAILATAAACRIALRLVLADASPEVMHAATMSLAGAAIFGIVCTAITAAAAAATVRSSVSGVVDQLVDATAMIASGRFDRRIDSSRTDELGAIARSIDELAERLGELQSARSSMLAQVSHELRTPLQVIRGEAFTLRRRSTDDRSIARLTLIDDEVERLSRLVDDMLDAASVSARSSAAVQVRIVGVGGILDAAATRFAAHGADRRISVEVDPVDARLEVLADEQRMQQVLANLIGNGMRHSPDGGVVRIGAAQDGDVVAITVTDEGSGIPSGRIGPLFEPFAQGEGSVGIAGLGLSIVRDIVHAHGGQIDVDSSPGSTTFVLRLPAVSDPTPRRVRRRRQLLRSTRAVMP